MRFPGRGPLLCGVTVLAGALCLLGQDSQFEKSFQQGAQASRGGHWEEAADDFAKAVALNPASAAAYFNLGLARLQQGRVDEALVALNRAVTQAPKLRGANLFLGIARYRKNGFAGAFAWSFRAQDKYSNLAKQEPAILAWQKAHAAKHP